MTPLPQSPKPSSPTPSTPILSLPPGQPTSNAARPSRLMASIYHDIGMAAVAFGLDLAVESLEPAAHQAVKRGSRYIYLMPRREDAPAPPSPK